jgi:DNA-binding CsgD family transcriptional regulator
VDGTWSLVDHVESDGRRWVLARRNAPGARDPKALSPRERDVLALAALGHSNKYVGYLLGLAPSTVAGHLAAAQRKLRLRSRSELIAMFGAGSRDGE